MKSDLEDLSDIVVYHNPPRNEANPCSIKNGGCSELCLFVKGRAKCACPSHFKLSKSNDIVTCQEPEDFLLFSQRNKISRLMVKISQNTKFHTYIRIMREILIIL